MTTHYQKYRDTEIRCSREYYKKHKEICNEKSRLYYEEHKEECNKRSREYYQKHKNRLIEYRKEYYIKNREDVLENKKKYYMDNIEKISTYSKNNRSYDPDCKREYHLKKRYGITHDEYMKLLEEQGGKCSICGKEPKNRIGKTNMNHKYSLFVDHNHVTGKVRGLLCQHCNVKLSAIENKSFMEKALEYLNKFDPI